MHIYLFAIRKDEELVLQRGSLSLLHFSLHFYGLPKSVPGESGRLYKSHFSLPMCFVCDYHSNWPKILVPILPPSRPFKRPQR